MALARSTVLADGELIDAIQRGDEGAFAAMVDAYSPALLRMARMFVRDRAVAEEVVQETWLAVLRGVDRFERRSSLRTWIFRILMNTAKTRALREARSIPFSAAVRDDEPVVDPDRFLGPDHRWPGGWMMGPSDWPTPEEALLQGETREVILGAIDALPDAQRIVITMRDVEGMGADEVVAALDISDGNQRILLHRARSKVRGALERHFGAIEPNRAALELE
ncbi:MAG: RNA polymerase sigma factor [Thermoleophilaceae bacterium]